MADTLDEIWRQCEAIERRLREESRAYGPFPGVFDARRRRLSGADYRRPPNRAMVEEVLRRLLDVAEHAFDFEIQVQVLDLLQDLAGTSEE